VNRKIKNGKNFLEMQLSGLEAQHRKLDEVIRGSCKILPIDQLELQRLKKQKLILKDKIARLRSKILPDIIA